MKEINRKRTHKKNLFTKIIKESPKKAKAAKVPAKPKSNIKRSAEPVVETSNDLEESKDIALTNKTSPLGTPVKRDVHNFAECKSIVIKK